MNTYNLLYMYLLLVCLWHNSWKNGRNGKLQDNFEFTFISLRRLVASRRLHELDLGNTKLQDLLSNSGFKYWKVYEHIDRNIAKVAGNKLPETYIPSSDWPSLCARFESHHKLICCRLITYQNVIRVPRLLLASQVPNCNKKNLGNWGSFEMNA